ncbi:MAG: hypothetical protein LBJ24_07340, partial [Treponema sp.]|nr:hypothetical protein [Treponema sp.]
MVTTGFTFNPVIFVRVTVFPKLICPPWAVTAKSSLFVIVTSPLRAISPPAVRFFFMTMVPVPV